MKLEDFATPLTASNRFIKASFGGFAGSGKSRTSAEFVRGAYKDMGFTKPILIIDNEKGSRFLIPFFKEAGIEAYVKDTTRLADVRTALDMLGSGQIDFLLIDTLTKVWYQYVRDYKAKNHRAFMELNDWGKVIPAWQEEFADKFVNTSGSIVFTGRGGYEYEKEEDTRDETGRLKKGGFVKSGVKMKLAGETPFEPDLNIWMEEQQDLSSGSLRQWREAQVLKDRSGLIDGSMFTNPTYENFKPVVQYLLGLEVGAVAGETDTRNRAPSENWDWQKNKQEKEIKLEEIQGLMVKHYPSQSQDDKRAKSSLLERHFSTLAWKKVETLTLDQLQAGYDAMKAELEPPKSAANEPPADDKAAA